MQVSIEREINGMAKESYTIKMDGCGCCATYRYYPGNPYLDENDTVTLMDIEETIQSLTDQLSIANDLKVILKCNRYDNES